MNTSVRRIAAFITPHGYGHASRACAVLLAMRALEPNLHFEIYTQTPRWFFEMTLLDGFTYHDLLTDIGLVQGSAMDEDLPETVRRLHAMYPLDDRLVQRLADELRSLDCEFVLCDIAPLGIRAAQAAGLKAVLEENFTWDWIYEGFLDENPNFAPHIDHLREIFRSAGAHIHTQPVCSYHLPSDLTVNVVSRKPRAAREETRARLQIAPDQHVVLLTMGGIGSHYPFLERLQNIPGVAFIIPGASRQFERRGSLALLAHHSDLYHPDLVEASNAVVGKLGYSTLAETYHAGLPFAFIPRPRFRESQAMSGFVLEEMDGIAIAEEEFYTGDWLAQLPRLLSVPRRQRQEPNGADQIAEFLLR